MDSRVDSTRAVGEAIARRARPPRVWLQASTATIYAHRFDAPNDEATGILGGAEPDAPDTWRFSIDVATAWEQAALDDADAPHTRKVLLRSAMVMSPDRGGVFDVLLGLVRCGLGGPAGDGRQYVSWIHDATSSAPSAGSSTRRPGRPGQPRRAGPAAERRVHAGACARAWGVRVGLPATAVDAGDRGVPDAHGNRTGAEEPAGGPGPPARAGLRVRLPGLARGRRRSGPRTRRPRPGRGYGAAFA